MNQELRSGSVDPGPLAIGTAPLGGLYTEVDDVTAFATLQASAEGGVTHFDTAPHYGRGLAEERLGAFLARVERPGRFTVSTKVGRHVRPTTRRVPGDIFTGAAPGESVFDFSAEGIRNQLDASRARLGRDRIDIVFLHDPDDHLEAALGAAEELSRQKSAGVIGAIGVGTNAAWVVDHLLDRVDLDTVLLAGRISLLETSGEPVAARCADQGIPLMAAGVLQSGILAGAGNDHYDYGPAPAGIRRRVGELAAVCGRFDVALRTAAIGHARRIRGVTTTLVGVRSPSEATTLLDDFRAEVPDRFWEAIDTVRAAWPAERPETNERTPT